MTKSCGTAGFRPRLHPDDPASGAAFTTESNFDAKGAQEGLRAGTAGAVAPVTATIGAGPQKIGGYPCPRAALGHDLSHCGPCDWPRSARECASALVRRWRHSHLDESAPARSYRRGFVRAASALRTVFGSRARSHASRRALQHRARSVLAPNHGPFQSESGTWPRTALVRA